MGTHIAPRAQSVRTEYVTPEWVADNLLQLSELHTQAMADQPWNEVWSNDLDGRDPRTNSPAMIRKLVEERADFFVTSVGGIIAGFGVGIRLTRAYLDSMEWGRATGYDPRNPRPGDYEMNLVIVANQFREQGLMSQLIEARFERTRQILGRTDMIWVQTIPSTEASIPTSRVQQSYLNRGFRPAKRMKIKETERVIFVRSAFP